ncbi:MAG: PocR ligand-binding domain-containing protein [Verrucomicrobia bacterium]|nr:PocR ligand-binding domain-containing protein [Verrucomicrobiota bacterium]
MPAAHCYKEAFRKATGVSLTIAPPTVTQGRLGFGKGENVFCTLVSRTPVGCKACLQTEVRAMEGAAKKQTAQQVYCFAGLTIVAVPVVVEKQHVATLLCGQVFRREPTQRDFSLVVRMLGEGLDAETEKKARRAYFETPVVTVERFQSILQLLTMFAQHLAEIAGRHALAWSGEEPRPVVLAKEFVQAHADQELTLAQVAEHAHVSPFYFCKLFKKITGMTLTKYVTRIRIEKAKKLLLDPLARIGEIAFAAGFGSIPHFNSLFHRYVGMAPSRYRTESRSQLKR